eukprot:TRINITY_DN35141_c0_g1_i1.p1 TRINITY_DN35141_c0_g1~~TRINITY_DN35141_c0_g1_i1.p1  ORF type:complete len:263 (+),score=56.38 TRINITY_DN35141_c0_g1_i1:57-791(+)
MPHEMSDDPLEGLEGPTLSMKVYKRSEHLLEWRSRCVLVQGRRLYYYDSTDDAVRTIERPIGMHKGWLDLTGAKVEESICTDDEEGETIYAVTVTEEYGVKGTGEECNGGSYTLGFAEEAPRAKLVETLRYASRPRWLSDDYSDTCMYMHESFSFLDRRHHCRRCGGLFLCSSTEEMPLPELAYEDPVRVCIPCAKNNQRASRWVTKTPFSERPLKTATIAEGMKSTLLDSVNAVTNLIETLAE